MARHAFLIAAHDNAYVLERLMRLLDDERNDIYLHVDRKVRGFDTDKFARLCRCSRVTLMPRRKVHWGDYSQVESILRMMKAALEGGEYAYLHLLSDSDLPLKSNDEIHQYFTANDGHEFVAFNEFPVTGREWVQYWHPLNRLVRSPYRPIRVLYSRTLRRFITVQRRLGVDRIRGFEETLKYGSDWYSISSSLAARLVSNEAMIRRRFRSTFIPTEFYVQTTIWDSEFRNKVHDYNDPYRSNVRLIDFRRGQGKGSPLTWRREHLPELLSSDRMFARKFDPTVDRAVVDALFSHLSSTARNSVS